MMYGFGDIENPRHDSIELLEDMVIDYITYTVSFICSMFDKIVDSPGNKRWATSFPSV